MRMVKPSVWIADTGASSHMTDNPQLFRQPMVDIRRRGIKVGGGRLYAWKKGTAEMKLKDGKNRLLEEEIEMYRKKWNETIMVVNELLRAIIAIKTSLYKVAKKVAVAERDWLAFWGIYKESDGSHPPWI
ncbi:hypothetical protein F5884DRAFT_904623 [Xylogone sp. PMI_703]|nr:hypothetical protein F5884DRAFT_904623 [Xylogone sp. PMI_703]